MTRQTLHVHVTYLIGIVQGIVLTDILAPLTHVHLSCVSCREGGFEHRNMPEVPERAARCISLIAAVFVALACGTNVSDLLE